MASRWRQSKTRLVVGVEPVGADAMHRSFRSGRPERLDGVDTIARVGLILCGSNIDRDTYDRYCALGDESTPA
ncbi:MAG: hypothetical protein OYL92_00755 [Acidobacteriota bacterium]|nr:hypothetical protein [Acidobacteriota bacterium]MDE2850184.1 hypothetical protein [Acidobacteriota bacterium]MDE2922920.1 hypothetical protein [Acidobacteriota bacterium]MDE3263476.1 hypothetical protein [Acidobacteriota bacterium]